MSRLGRGFPNNALLRTPVLVKSVTYDAVGAGNTGTNPSWSHTISGNCVLIWISNTGGTPTSVTVGASTATLVNSWSDGSSTILYLYKLQNPPTGSQTVTVNGSSTTAANSVSYSGVTTVGSPTSATGSTSSTTVSMTVSSTLARAMYVMGSSYTSNSGATYSAPSGNQRVLIAHAGTTNEPLLVEDSAGNGGSLTLSATRSQTGFPWVSAVVSLSP